MSPPNTISSRVEEDTTPITTQSLCAINTAYQDNKGILPDDTAHLHCPLPAPHLPRLTTAKSGAATGTVISGDPSSFARSTNNNSSSSQNNPPHLPPENEQGYYHDAGAKRRKMIAPSTVEALRSCSTYVTRVKQSLLASNHEEKFNAFLELLSNWSEQGLASQEVLSQMQLILQDVCPELLAAFPAFLPADTQEEARLHLAAARMSSTTRAPQEDEMQSTSSTNDNRFPIDYDDASTEDHGNSPSH